MGKEILTFGNIQIEKSNLYCHIEKVLVSNKTSGKKNCKYFIGSLYNGNKVKPLNIMLSKPSAYVKSYDRQTEWMNFLIEDDDLLEKHNAIWNKVSSDIKKKLIVILSIIKVI